MNKRINDAITNIQKEVELLTKKADETILKPKKLLPYPDKPDVLRYNLDYIGLGGTYNNGNYYRWAIDQEKSVDKLNDRKSKINAALDAYLEQIKPTFEDNKAIIAHNILVVDRIKLFMGEIGIPSTYSERDPKSRARIPKTISHSAGYLQDIRRNISLADSSYNAILNQIKTVRDSVDRTTSIRISKIVEEEKVAAKRAKEEEDARKLAYYQVKYGLPSDADYEIVLDKILSLDKYLRLGHYLLMNRNDWNDGYSYAETGLGGFGVDSDEDKLIVDTLQKIISDYDVDGRYFRDSEYGYDYLFSKVPEDLYKDYNEVFNNVEMDY